MFTILILIATGKIPVAPVVMVGTEYWKDMEKFLEDGVRDGVTPEHYLKFYTITDDEDEIINIIKNAPARRDLKTLSQE
jgi:predicted Rossmann-fold nucleotide-binding protein